MATSISSLSQSKMALEQSGRDTASWWQRRTRWGESQLTKRLRPRGSFTRGCPSQTCAIDVAKRVAEMVEIVEVRMAQDGTRWHRMAQDVEADLEIAAYVPRVLLILLSCSVRLDLDQRPQ